MGRRYIATRRPMYFAAGNTFVAPYDSLTTDIKAAYSIRRLFTSYTGSAVRIRRTSDNAESDIGFTASGDFDTSAFSSFIGAGQGFVTTWYDQSGQGLNIVSATTTLQPELQLNLQNTRPGLVFTAANSHRLAHPTAASWKFLHYQQSTFGLVLLASDTALNKYVIATCNNNSADGYYMLAGSTTEEITISVSRQAGPITASTILVSHTNSAISTPTRTVFSQIDAANPVGADREFTYRNGTLVSGTNSTTAAGHDANPSFGLHLGGRSAGSSMFDGRFFEAVFWTGTKESTYRLTYESSARSYYGHY